MSLLELLVYVLATIGAAATLAVIALAVWLWRGMKDMDDLFPDDSHDAIR